MTYWSAVGPTSSARLTSVQQMECKSAESGKLIPGAFSQGLWSPLSSQAYMSHLRHMSRENAMTRKCPGERWGLAGQCVQHPGRPSFAHSPGLAPPAAACVLRDRPVLSLCFTPSMASQVKELPSWSWKWMVAFFHCHHHSPLAKAILHKEFSLIYSCSSAPHTQ